jgi:hypothetical protein
MQKLWQMSHHLACYLSALEEWDVDGEGVLGFSAVANMKLRYLQPLCKKSSFCKYRTVDKNFIYLTKIFYLQTGN